MSFDPAARRRIGTRELSVSQLGVGCAPFGRVSPADTDESVQACFAELFAHGLRYYDVAPFYGTGLAEHRLGACLRRIDRREVVLSTKVGRLLDPVVGGVAHGAAGGTYPFQVRYDYTYDATLRSIEHSLQRLGTNALDIVLIHDVNKRWQGDMLESRYKEAMSGAHRALEELRSAGTIKAFGVGVNDWTILERFARDGDFDCFMLAGRYTLLDHTAIGSFLPECQRRNISVLMAAPFNSGILATGATPGATFFYVEAEAEIKERVARMEAVCTRHGVDLAAAAIQFPLHHPAIASVVTGMRSVSEARANLAHCRAAIPRDFWAEMKREGLISADVPTG